ncbi:hypothetical protein ACLOJK_039015 [Asimina triloba]
MAGIAGIEQAVVTSVDGLDQADEVVYACIELADGGSGSCRRDRAAARGCWKRRRRASSTMHPSGQCGSRCVRRGSAVAGAYDGRPGFDDHGPCMVGQAVETRLAVSCR